MQRNMFKKHTLFSQIRLITNINSLPKSVLRIAIRTIIAIRIIASITAITVAMIRPGFNTIVRVK